MAKFTTDYVNLIATNLRDRYKSGFPILKELLQNADDANATSLAFGYHPGFADSAMHELLKGPALWALNNGRFSAADRQAIQSFGLNSKAAEAGVIGKFGLGMKSVFHLCEGFFYVASDGKLDYLEILSPWFQDTGSLETHAAWENIAQRDRLALTGIATAQPEVQSEKSWFMLWIPLRRRSHVAKIEGVPTAPIMDRYPGDEENQDLDFLAEPGIDRRIGALLPLLRSLHRVRFGGTPTLPAFDLQMELAAEANRLDHVTDALQLTGTVADGRPKNERLYYWARQRVLGRVAPFSDLQNSSGWPKSNAIIEDGKRGPVPDKAQPEAAIVISHGDKRRGHLSVQWAVFLPTDELRFCYEAYIPDSSREYRIVLHGQFFVDAGRRGIEGMDRLGSPIAELSTNPSEAEVQAGWNQALAQQLVLPLLLPVLADYVREHGLKDAEIAALTSALSECTARGDTGTSARFFGLFGEHICREHVWVRKLERHAPSWKLISSRGPRLLPIPKPANDDHERPWRALPGLSNLSDYAFVDHSAPRVAEALSNWNAELVVNVLQGLPETTLAGSVELRYLVEFLSLERDRALRTSIVQDQLVSVLRQGLLECKLADIRANRESFKQLIQLLLPPRRHGLGTKAADAKGALPESIYRKLLGKPAAALLLPADLAPDSEPGAPSATDIQAWLRVLGRAVEDSEEMEMLACLEAAKSLLASVGSDREHQQALLRRNPDLRILKAFDVRTNADAAFSLNDLLNAHSDLRLFRVIDIKDKLGLTKHLSAVLTEIHPLVVEAPVSNFVRLASDKDIPGSDDASAIFRTIGGGKSAPRLNDLTSRLKLLDHVGGCDLTSPPVQRGVRYLLHGIPERFTSTDILWKDSSGQKSPWVRLWRMVEENSWSVLANDLSASIPDRCSAELKISAVEQASIIKRLRQCTDFSKVSPIEFSESEREQILGQLDDETAWRKLPLHRDDQERFGPVTLTSYLGGAPRLPDILGTNLRFIVLSLDEAHKKRQANWIERWTDMTAATEVLKSSQPSSHWRYLMDRLAECPNSNIDLPTQWFDVAWLPLRSGGAISLASLIRLDDMAAEIGALAAQCDYAYASPNDLAEEVRLHSGFQRLENLVPAGDKALPVLALLMAETGHSLGSTSLLDAEFVERHMQLLGSLQSLPGWRLVNKAAVATSFDAVDKNLRKDLAVQLAPDHAESVLAELSSKEVTSQRRAVFSVYLCEWVNSASAAELRPRLPSMTLLAGDGSWQPSKKLVCGVYGVDASSTLHPSLEDPLSGIVFRNDGAPEGPQIDLVGSTKADEVPDFVDALDGWCEPFAQSSVQPAIGALIGIFGQRAKPLAESWLKPIAYADYLRRLNWKDPGYEGGSYSRKCWMGGNNSAAEAFGLLQPVLTQSSGKTVSVQSLLEQPLVIELSSSDAMKTLLAGSLHWRGGYGVKISLRPIKSLREFDLRRQKAILQRTAEDLLKNLYNQPHANLTELWNLFEDADQVELDVARSMILEGLPQLLNQLSGVKKQFLLARSLEAVDKRRREIASARHAKTEIQGHNDRFSTALDELAELVETNGDVQKTLLDAIRKKMACYQYELSSIPFEILQNADDAVSEYQQMQEAEGHAPFESSDIGRFVVTSVEDALVMVHWGRPINFTGRHEGYQPEYAKDLERMLMLGASAKEVEDDVTGKFGLGFKSVFLATDRPVVASGDLHFEIIAGCLPQRAELSAPAQRLVGSYQISLRPTVLELPMNQGTNALVSRFKSLAALCTVFARKITQVHIEGLVHSWAPQILLKKAGTSCEFGELQLPNKADVVPSHLLVLRSKSGGIALRINGGIVAFDHEADFPAPAIWVNAPTRGMAAVGVIINAEFEVDTGRGSLPQGAAAKRNMETAKQLADILAPLVADLLHETQADWQDWSTRFASPPQLTAAGFWHSLWSTLFNSKPSEDASQDALLTAGHVERLFSHVLQRTDLVPNGMPNEFAGLVKASSLCLSVKRDRVPVLSVLRQWLAFQNVYPIHGWCTEEVHEWLRRIADSDADESIVDLDRAAVMAALGCERQLSPDQVVYLAAVIQVWPKGPTEDQGWRNELSSILLMSRSGIWRPAAALLFFKPGLADPLEEFAPSETLLDASYEAQGASWALVHPLLTPLRPQETVAHWCLNAADPTARHAAVRWLARNLNAPYVWDHILKRPANHWISLLRMNHDLFTELPEEDQQMMLFKLGLLHIVGDPFDTIDEPVVDLDLPTIHRWWRSRRNDLLPKYEQAFWPQRIDRARLADNAIDRETWMTLFSLAVFRRFGRVRDEQNRGFLEFLNAKGWWETISLVHPDTGAEAWLDILRQYAEATQVSGEFEQWMDSFPRLYRMARWFDEYVELFLGLEYRDAKSAAVLLTPATDASLTGSGFDAPTLRRTLRLGHSLVIRELLRAGVLKSGVAQAKAFMPSQPVLQFLAQMGHPNIETSEEIHAILVSKLDSVAGASFDGDYDIPILLLAGSPELQRDVVQWAKQQIEMDEEEAMAEEESL